ncbi:MAG: hypothetical protein K2W97_05660 [Chthoniobacterales bacterium]|nr:hypothetical protein [Chthoniobacterales bacterium]
MGSLESLKTIAGYRENPEGGYLSKSTFGIGTSRALTVAKNGEGKTTIAVAPRSFFGRLFAWLVPYRGGATAADYIQQNNLKKAIEEHLVKAGMNTNQAKHIVEQVVGDNPQRAITRSDLRQIIGKAKNALAAKPSLPQEKSMVTSSSSSTLAETSSSVVSEEGFVSEEDLIFRAVDPQAEQKAKELIDVSKSLLKQIIFDPKEVFELRKRVERQRTKVEVYFYKCSPGSKVEQSLDKLEKKLGTSLSPEGEDKLVLPPKMLLQLGEQRDHLIVKEKMLSDYLKRDPFNDKNVHYSRRIYAEAAKLVFEKKFDEINESQREGLKSDFQAWYQAEVDSYEAADPTKRSQEPDFYLNKTNPENPLVKYSALRAAQKLSELLPEAISESAVKQAASEVMNEHLDWEKVESDMVFSLGEKTGSYSQVSTPLSKSETAVGGDLREQGILGMIPSVRDNGRAPTNARLTQLFKMEYVVNPHTGEREEKKVLLHERQQHGINDHFAIQDPRERHKANVNSMKQLVQSGAEADKAFIQDAIAHPTEEHQVFYINTNLTTPTWTPRGNKNNEEAYSRHQGAAMRAIEEVQTFSVLNPDNLEERADINLKVTCIDFRFPVNYAISSFSEDKRSIDPGMVFAWPALKAHNEGEFKKLFGSLDDKAPIGGIMESTYQQLEGKVNSGDEGAIELKTEIDQQITYVRNMFRTEAYKTAGEDRFKMPRHIDLLVNAFRQASELVDDHQVRVVNAGGCMSGKDREGVANAENEAAVIIQDLGGKVEPGEGGRYDEETQAIYDSCMTGVVHNTRQVTGIGGSKNAEEIANQMSDPHAIAYAKGGAKFVAA